MLRKSDRVTDLLLGFTRDSRKNRMVFTQPRDEIAAANPKSLDPEKEVVDGGGGCEWRENLCGPLRKRKRSLPVNLCDLDSKSHTGQESLTKQTICLKNLLQGRNQRGLAAEKPTKANYQDHLSAAPRCQVSRAHANDARAACRHRDGQRSDPDVAQIPS